MVYFALAASDVLRAVPVAGMTREGLREILVVRLRSLKYLSSTPWLDLGEVYQEAGRLAAEVAVADTAVAEAAGAEAAGAVAEIVVAEVA